MQATDASEGDPSSNGVILFPAFNIGRSELFYFLKAIESKGLLDRLLLICNSDFIPECRMQLKHCILDDFKSYNALLRKIELWKSRWRIAFKGILAIDEEMQFRLSRNLARHFGLEFFSDITCFRASNKFLMKNAFRKHGVPTSDFILFSKPLHEKAIRIGFPNVLKVLSGTQSQYIFFNKDMGELTCNFERLKKALWRVNGDPRFVKRRVVLDGRSITLDPKRQFLLEAFVPGDEYSCDFMAQSGTIHLIRVTEKIRSPHFGRFAGYHLLNEQGLASKSISKSHLIDICRNISRALSIFNGVCMVDFKSSNGRITVLEASMRPGLSAFNDLMHDIYGYTSLALMVIQKMGIYERVSMPEATGTVLYLCDSADGTLQSLDSEELRHLQRHLEIKSIYLYQDADDSATGLETDRTSLLKGYMLLGERAHADVTESEDQIGSKKRRSVYEAMQ